MLRHCLMMAVLLVVAAARPLGEPPGESRRKLQGADAAPASPKVVAVVGVAPPGAKGPFFTAYGLPVKGEGAATGRMGFSKPVPKPAAKAALKPKGPIMYDANGKPLPTPEQIAKAKAAAAAAAKAKAEEEAKKADAKDGDKAESADVKEEPAAEEGGDEEDPLGDSKPEFQQAGTETTLDGF